MPFHVLGFVEFAISHTFEIWIVGRKTLQPVDLSFLFGDQETRYSGGMTIKVLLFVIYPNNMTNTSIYTNIHVHISTQTRTDTHIHIHT